MTGSAQYQIGIDTGGTFTDLVCRGASGCVHHAKVLSTPADPARAILAAVVHAEQAWGVQPSQIVRFVHGTTVATNAVLERKGAVTGLITTRGFRDTLELGRFNRRDEELYNPVPSPNTPVFLVPRHRRLEVRERVGAQGEVVEPLNEQDVVDAADELVRLGTDSIAIAFLFSFLRPEHERRAAAIIRERHPGIAISLSSFVDPAYREYERTAVTCFDAYVKPILTEYLQRTESALRERGVQCGLQVIHSRGGITRAATACERPIRLFLSGPAGGVIGGLSTAQAAGEENAITLDIGGTSTDIALISKGWPLTAPLGWVDGFAVRVPMVDVNSIGAGGGSIAWLDRAGGLHVGPGSAGADPGPACYARGGTLPTVTDASVVLGYLSPESFGAGHIRIDVDRAHEAIERVIAKPMGLSAIEAALGIHRVVNAHMAEGIRFVSVKRGHDPRRFSLMPLGGGGGLHAIPVARALGMTSVVLPQLPGVLSAIGMLAAPIEHERAAAWPVAMDGIVAEDFARAFAPLDAECERLMNSEAASGLVRAVLRFADVCYEGQSHHIEVAVDLTGDDPRPGLADRFHEAHRHLYGHASRDRAVRIVNVRSVHQASHASSSGIELAHQPSSLLGASRQVFLEGHDAFVTARVIDRQSLARGDSFDGPAVLHQSDTTTIVPPGWGGKVISGGLIRVQRNEARE